MHRCDYLLNIKRHLPGAICIFQGSYVSARYRTPKSTSTVCYFLPKNEFNVFCPFFPAGTLLMVFGRADAEAGCLSSSLRTSLFDADPGLVVFSELSTANSSSAEGLGAFSFPLPLFAAFTFRPAFLTSSREGSSDSEAMLSYSEYVSTASTTYLSRQRMERRPLVTYPYISCRRSTSSLSLSCAFSDHFSQLAILP